MKFSYFKHPNSVCLSYFNHLKLSLYFSKKFFIASIKAFIHAFLPNKFITSTSDTVSKIQSVINISRC